MRRFILSLGLAAIPTALAWGTPPPPPPPLAGHMFELFGPAAEARFGGCRPVVTDTGPPATPPAPSLMPHPIALGARLPLAERPQHGHGGDLPWGSLPLQDVDAAHPPRVAVNHEGGPFYYHWVGMHAQSAAAGRIVRVVTDGVDGMARVWAITTPWSPEASSPSFTLGLRCGGTGTSSIGLYRIWAEDPRFMERLPAFGECRGNLGPMCDVSKLPRGKALIVVAGPPGTTASSEWVDFDVMAGIWSADQCRRLRQVEARSVAEPHYFRPGDHARRELETLREGGRRLCRS